MTVGATIIENVLSEILKKKVSVTGLKNLSGGCINNALKVETDEGNYFIKYNSFKDPGMFQAEAQGLNLLRKSTCIDIPEVFGVFTVEGTHFLALEFVSSSYPQKNYWEDFGTSLACLHRTTSEYFGLDIQNYIGSLPQNNKPQKSWIDFFREERLEVQLNLALNSGKIDSSLVKKMEELYQKLPDLLISEPPSLLHGDLWSGNVMTNEKGRVSLIDPAVYYGSREAELAFTTLFGGFDDRFYESYHTAFPMEKGFRERFEIYNLYPLLVHVNLFGGGYIRSVVSTVQKYV